MKPPPTMASHQYADAPAAGGAEPAMGTAVGCATGVGVAVGAEAWGEASGEGVGSCAARTVIRPRISAGWAWQR